MITATAKVFTAGKIMAETAMNFEHSGLRGLPMMLLTCQLPHVATGRETVALTTTLPKELSEHLAKQGEVAVSGAKDVTAQHNSTPGVKQAVEVQTIDERYMRFGNVEDLFKQLTEGRLPSARTVYLALLDILDFLDMGLMGNKLTEARQSDHLHTHVFKVTKTTQTHLAAPRKDEKSYCENGKEIAHTSTHRTSTTIETITVTDSVDGGTDITISKASQTVTLHLTEHSISTRAERSWLRKAWDGVVGHDDRVEVKEYKEQSGWSKVETLDQNTGKMVLSSYQELGRQQSDIIVSEQRNWNEGLITWLPMGSVVNMAGKANAGYKITTGDWLAATVDVGTTLITFGAGTIAGKMLGKGATQVAGAVTGKAGAKVAEVGAKIATRAKAAAGPTLGKPVSLSSTKALRSLDNIADSFSEETLSALATSSSHVPIRSKVWKAMYDCHRYEKNGMDLSSDLHKIFAHEGPRGHYKADSLLDIYEQAKSFKIFTPKNNAVIREGYCPRVGKESFDLDHFVPVHHAPELKARVENIRILPASVNRARKDAIDADCIAKMNELSKVLDWTPSSTLSRSAQTAN